eukprot:159974_1
MASNKCNLAFDDCKTANTIKNVLLNFNKIIRNKGDKPIYELEKDLNDVLVTTSGINNNVKLLNDFYHIKYQHPVNDDPNCFQIFYEYLFDNDNVLKCDINECKSVRQYYRCRNIRSEPAGSHTLQILCRIHTYFFHAYETSILTQDEIAYIETQLNGIEDEDEETMNDMKIELTATMIQNKKQKKLQMKFKRVKDKYMTEDHIYIDCGKLAQIISVVGIKIDFHELETVFSVYGYHKHNLIDDLCDIFISKAENNITLSHILVNELSVHDEFQRHQIYDLVLHKFIQKEEINNPNFIKILKAVAFQVNSNISHDQIERIAISKNLTGNLFIKENKKEFKNSLKFGKLFKTITCWKKKEWTQIYRKIYRWECKEYKLPVTVGKHESPELFIREIKNNDEDTND